MSQASTKDGTETKADDYKPKPHEVSAVKRTLARREKTPPKARFKVSHPKGQTTIDSDHPDMACNYVLLADMLGTCDSDLAEGLLTQLANVAQTGDALTSADLNAMVSVVGGIAPRDPTEALLACQMAAIHKATMNAARRLNRSNTIEQQDSASNMLNKLARSFAAQMEALKRYRSSGEQSIRVQHVTVNEGGQAIVGNVQSGGGGVQKNASQSHAPREGGIDERSPALLGHEQAVRLPMPSSGHEGPQRVSNARSASGCPDGGS